MVGRLPGGTWWLPAGRDMVGSACRAGLHQPFRQKVVQPSWACFFHGRAPPWPRSAFRPCDTRAWGNGERRESRDGRCVGGRRYRAAVRIVEEAVADLAIEVLPAYTVAEGELLFDRRTPDVLLVDIMFPTGSGLELRGAPGRRRHAPVIFLTASEDSNVAIEAMKLGAYDYLLKPLDAARLGEVIHRAVETRRMMQSPLQASGGDGKRGRVLR